MPWIAQLEIRAAIVQATSAVVGVAAVEVVAEIAAVMGVVVGVVAAVAIDVASRQATA